ncbi:unnamed protein product [Eretmochelys imbricata]
MKEFLPLLSLLVAPRWALAQIFQPPWLTYVEGERILIPCSQNATSHDMMSWYKQPQQGQGAPSFLGIGHDGSSTAGEFTMAVDKAARSTNLTRGGASLSDAGIYYCTVRDTARGTQVPAAQKPTAWLPAGPS